MTPIASPSPSLPPGFVPLTVGSGIRAAATRAPGKTAILCQGRQRTYAQLVEAMNRVAHAVVGLGLRPGQKMQALQYGDRVELIPLVPLAMARGILKGLATDIERDGDRT